jgi:hypothetical protein
VSEFTKNLPRMPGFYLVKGSNFELAAELRRFDGDHLRWFTTKGTDVGHDQFRSDTEYKRVRFDATPATEDKTMSSGDAPKEIYLQPKCCADPEYGQLWCEDPNPEVCGDGKEWVKYVRHDLATPPTEEPAE